MNYKSKLGQRGEVLAAEFLTKNGYTVTDRNLHISYDEIDIIAEDENYIVFAEVKSRAATKINSRYGIPSTAVGYTKQARLIRSAEEYIRNNNILKQPRIDVIEVYFPNESGLEKTDVSKLMPLEIRHIRNAVRKGR